MILRTIIVLAILLSSASSSAQSNDFYLENTKRIDEYLSGSVCGNIVVYPAKYKNARVKGDSFVISFMSEIVDDELTDTMIAASIKRLGPKRAVVKERLNGLIKIKEVLLKGNYLRATITLEFIEGLLVRRKVIWRTTTNAECSAGKNRILDYNLVKLFFLRKTQLLFSPDFEEMVSDTILQRNIITASKKNINYKFNVPGLLNDSLINEIFRRQYQDDGGYAYDFDRAPNEFIQLLKLNKTNIIQDLLYSPNYFMAINAMEALIYLRAIGKVEMDDRMRTRFSQLMSGSFIIMQRASPDLLYRKEGYKALGVTDDKIIRKYSLSM